MKAHDVAVNLIRNYAKEERDVTESDIREINKIILVEPFWKEAITPDGQPTKRLIEPGKYKEFPNHVKLSNGEVFYFSSPEQTPGDMQKLIEWFRSERDNKTMHPVELAALMHYKLVRIHPFDDSNGRTSRLIMNYVLLKYGYPPVIIKSSDKKNYFFALNKADTGDIQAIVDYVSAQVLYSLDLMHKLKKGESIEEQDDLDKEIELFKREKNSKSDTSKIKSIGNLMKVFHQNLIRLFEVVIEKQQIRFDDLFVTNKYWIGDNSLMQEVIDKENIDSIVRRLFDQISNEASRALEAFVTNSTHVNLKFFRKGYKPNQDQNLVLNKTLSIKFNTFNYEIVYEGKLLIQKAYSEYYLSESELYQISDEISREIFEIIKHEKS
jgi:fido (protein-threonine AMPylation protein)